MISTTNVRVAFHVKVVEELECLASLPRFTIQESARQGLGGARKNEKEGKRTRIEVPGPNGNFLATRVSLCAWSSPHHCLRVSPMNEANILQLSIDSHSSLQVVLPRTAEKIVKVAVVASN